MHKAWMLVSMAVAAYFGITLYVNLFFDKASQHTGVWTLWTMVLIGRVDNIFVLLFLLLPVIMWSRLVLKKHTWPQLFWGIAIGMLAGLLTWES